jgi:hypothetical protein
VRNPGQIVVEFYGIPRHRAGRAEVAVPAGTVGDVLRAVMRACPGLDLLDEGGALSRHYLLSLDGREFLKELSRELPPASRLLLLSADAGG